MPGNKGCLGKHKHHSERPSATTVGTRSIKTSLSPPLLSWLVRQILSKLSLPNQLLVELCSRISQVTRTVVLLEVFTWLVSQDFATAVLAVDETIC